MNQYLDDVKSELKRLDHILYVSLKYTRTVDIIKHAIDRMISSFDIGFAGIFEQVKRKRKKFEIPEQPIKKCQVLKEIFPEDKRLAKFIDFYLLLRKLNKADYTKREEYRRHVTMIANLGPNNIFEVNIDILMEFHAKIKKFVEYLQEKLK